MNFLNVCSEYYSVKNTAGVYAEDDGRHGTQILPWHFPMTEPKSSLTDLRKKNTHTHTEKTLRHYKDVTHPRLHTHTHTSAHALSLMSWYRVGNSHWWLCQLNSSMDQTDKVCRAATVWTDSSLSSRPYPLSCVNTHSHQLIPRNKAIKHCD